MDKADDGCIFLLVYPRIAIFHDWSTIPPHSTPARKKALLRAYEPLVSLNKALLNPLLT